MLRPIWAWADGCKLPPGSSWRCRLVGAPRSGVRHDGTVKRAAVSIGFVLALAVAGCGGDSPEGTGGSLGEKAQVFVLGRDGGTARRLSDDDHDYLALAWSPDGRL